MGWEDPTTSPLADMIAAAAAYSGPRRVPPRAMLTDAEYELALELAGGDPDRIEAEAIALGFSGVDRIR
jgi:hypothetical protein